MNLHPGIGVAQVQAAKKHARRQNSTREDVVRVTLQPYLGTRAESTAAKTLMFSSRITMADFKKRCGDKLKMKVDRIFTIDGGEIDSVREIKEQDILVCTQGIVYMTAAQRQISGAAHAEHRDNGNGARGHGTTTTTTTAANNNSAALRRFQNAVKDIARRAKRLDVTAGNSNRRLSVSDLAGGGGPEMSSMPRTLAGTKLVRSAGPTAVISHDSSPAEGALQHDGRGTQRNVASRGIRDDQEGRSFAHDSTPKMHAEEPGPFRKNESEKCSEQCFPNRHHALPIIMPESNFRMSWDALVAIFVVYYSLVVPMRLVFDLAAPGRVAIQVDLFVNFIFVVDIILNFRTAFKKNGTLVTRTDAIRQHYLKTWFFIDFISSMPFDVIFLGKSTWGQSVNKLLRMVRIFKLLRVLRLTRILARVERHTRFDPSILRLAKLVGILIFTWHWLACCYWMIATMSSPDLAADTWAPHRSILVSRDLNVQYAYAFFWSVVVTSGIGWDIIPETPLQIYFTTGAIVMGLLMYAIIIGSASTLLSNMDLVKSERKRKMNEIKAFMRHRKVPPKLADEILSSMNTSSLATSTPSMRATCSRSCP